MEGRVPDNLGGPEQRQYVPSSMTRFATPNFACTAKDAPNAAEYSPLIAVAYISVHTNFKADLPNGATMNSGNRPKQRSALRLNEPELTLLRRGNGPDPRLVELVRLLARRAAREVFEEQTKERRTTRS
ncbi:hypothetical protein ACVDG8_012185 [Mesorhizobium sp. ORM8.1]